MAKNKKVPKSRRISVPYGATVFVTVEGEDYPRELQDLMDKYAIDKVQQHEAESKDRERALSMNQCTPSPDEVAQKVRGLIGSLPYQEQNRVIAGLVRYMRNDRQILYNTLQDQRIRYERDENEAYQNIQDLESAVRGDFAVFTKTVGQ